MERTRLILAVLSALLIAGPAWAGGDGPGADAQTGAPSRRTALRFASGRRLTADVVDTPLARERGLMFRKYLPQDYGMLFVFPVEAPMTFWMKNTWVSLDIVFIGRDKRITRLHERVRPSTKGTTDREVARVGGLAQYVLELPAGAARRYRLKAGQPLVFDVPVPER